MVKSMIYAVVVAIGITILFPDVGLSASRSFRSSGKFSAPAVHSQHDFTGGFRLGSGVGLRSGQGLHRFRDSLHHSGFHSRFGGEIGFVGGHVIDAGDVIIIQVPSSAPNPPPPGESTHTRTYVYPQWVDGGHGVEILRPGYLSDEKQRVER